MTTPSPGPSPTEPLGTQPSPVVTGPQFQPPVSSEPTPVGSQTPLPQVPSPNINPQRTRRPRVIALIGAGLLVLVLVGFGGWWFLLRSGGEQLSVVHGLNSEPRITWEYSMPADGSWTPVGTDSLAVSTPMAQSGTLSVTLLDLATGKQRWKLDVTDKFPARGTALVTYELGGTGQLAVVGYPADYEKPARLLVVSIAKGTITAESDLPSGTSLLSSPQGNLYLINHQSAQWSKLAPGYDPRKVEWTASQDPLDTGDAQLAVTEVDGYALLSWTLNTMDQMNLAKPGFLAAAKLDNGDPPPWAPRETSSTFSQVGSVTVETKYGGQTVRHIARDKNGTELWHAGPEFGYAVTVGDLLLAPQGDDSTRPMRIDPATGKAMWKEPPTIGAGASLAILDGQLMAIGNPGRPVSMVIDPSSGKITRQVDYPVHDLSSIFLGEQKLIAAKGTETEVTLTGLNLAKSTTLWSKTFTGYQRVQHVGSHLILVNTKDAKLAGLG